MCPSSAMFEINWVVSVEVRPTGHSIRISAPERPRVVLGRQPKTICVFSQPVDIRIRRKSRL